MERLTNEIDYTLKETGYVSCFNICQRHRYESSHNECNGCQIHEALKKLGFYEDIGLTPEQIVATLTENKRLKVEIFKLAIRDGGIPCEWCESGNDDTNDMCRVCQDNEFKLFECRSEG